MDLSDPARSVVPSLDRQVLAVLAGTTRALTGREIQRLARAGSQSGVQRILNRLAEDGLVASVQAGSARLYSLNREHVAAPVVTALVGLRGELFARIRRALAEWPLPPAAAAVFGSAARGDGGPESDIDVFLVRPDGVEQDDAPWAEAIDKLRSQIQRWSGNPAGIIDASPAQVASMIARNEPIVGQLRRDAINLTESSVLDVPAETA